MIIRNNASSLARLFKTADNRWQTMDHGPQAVNGSQLTYLNLKPFFLWLVVKKQIIRN